MVESIAKEVSLQAKKLAGLLLDQNKTLAVAESCTGGWLSKVLTDLSGSSEWFLGGVVSYSNQTKQDFLKVQEQCLDEFGAVSQQVAEQMVGGVDKAFSSSISLSITGIAGPSGGSNDKPVGLVWFGVKKSLTQARSCSKTFTGNREQVRQQAVLMALQLLVDMLTE